MIDQEQGIPKVKKKLKPNCSNEWLEQVKSRLSKKDDEYLAQVMTPSKLWSGTSALTITSGST